MFMDLLRFLTFPYPWYLTPMGYVREQAGITASGSRPVNAWRFHGDVTVHLTQTALRPTNN